GRGGTDAALTEGPMQPDVLDPEFGALSHRAFRFVWRGGDDDGVDASGDAPQVVVTAGTLDLVRIGIDREYLITAVTQTLEHGVGAVPLRLSRYACYGDPFMRQELGSGFLHRWHLPPRHGSAHRNPPNASFRRRHLRHREPAATTSRWRAAAQIV